VNAYKQSQKWIYWSNITQINWNFRPLKREPGTILVCRFWFCGLLHYVVSWLHTSISEECGCWWCGWHVPPERWYATRRLWHNNVEDHALNSHCYENLKSYDLHITLQSVFHNFNVTLSYDIWGFHCGEGGDCVVGYDKITRHLNLVDRDPLYLTNEHICSIRVLPLFKILCDSEWMSDI
jgi:hypothetical protein